MGYCNSCEKEVKAEKFCPKCGKQLTVAETAVESAKPQPDVAKSQMAMWPHLGSIIGVVLGYSAIPVISWFFLWLPGFIILKSNKATDFDKRHAKASLNFQLTALVMFGIFVIGDFILIGAGQSVAFIFYGLTTLAIVILFQILGVIFAIIGSVQASNLREYRYPLSFRFVK